MLLVAVLRDARYAGSSGRGQTAIGRSTPRPPFRGLIRLAYNCDWGCCMIHVARRRRVPKECVDVIFERLGDARSGAAKA
jgi:hypothetical protein